MAPATQRDVQNLWLHGVGVSVDDPIPEPRHDTSASAQLLADARGQCLAWIRAHGQQQTLAREWRHRYEDAEARASRLALWVRLLGIGAVSGWLLFGGAVRALWEMAR